MDINFVLNIIQFVLAIVLTGLVLLQQQDAGYYSQTTTINRTKRGSEKLVFNLTIVIGITFVLTSIINTIY